MTAEVAILNKSGVALAADSAVTIGQDANKIWTSADKVFQLSETDPVGIMVYGNAAFHGLPWETVIKAYRRETGNKSFPKLSDHAESFLKFLGATPTLFSKQDEDAQDSRFAAFVLHMVSTDIEVKIDEATTKSGAALTVKDVESIVNATIKSILARMKENPPLAGLSVTNIRAGKSRYRRLSKPLIKQFFGQLPMSKQTAEDIARLVGEYASRSGFTDHRSGVVISGFGANDLLPSLRAYLVEGKFAGKPRAHLDQTVAITQSNEAAVVPFAQQEMVRSFMHGIVDDLDVFMRNSTKDLFSGFVKAIAEALEKESQSTTKKVEGLASKTDEIVTKLFELWDGRKRRYWEPVVANVMSLPKDELAAMAEAFVNLTKFRRRVTTERETVGGPIDVAVITAGDGFIWIKRKHYFEPDLNPRVMTRYSRP